ncbi:ABC transporter substrate-binding protein [uncultured Desulfovibrio sp.]|uniref:substrate-binding periplasmic protein n=1 Tax=uncultured Desulfovibrio sp. TaxID=167968 RepID=UPI00265C9913|nr:transporter substrate-binding domain-containing protein [uncultured Desulfovibrio sp.]
MQRFLIVVLCLHLCLAAPSAAATGTELRVGLSDDYPPLSYMDGDGQRRGFEYDLADSLCRRLGRACIWTFATQEKLLQGLRDGSLDLIFAQRLEPKQEGLLYSTPYYHSRAMCIGRPGGLGPGDAGARIGVYRGSVLEQRARGFWPGAAIVTGSVGELIRRLQHGEIDVLFINDLAGYAFLLTDGGQGFDRLDVPFDAETKATGSRVAVRAGRPDLLDAVNRALKALLYSGELHNRSRNYFQYIIY